MVAAGLPVYLFLLLLGLFIHMCRTQWTFPKSPLRLTFWFCGIVLACLQSWNYRYYASADAIAYLDMSDGALPGQDWHRLINGVWSPLYPFVLGICRWLFGISPGHEIVAAHLLNVVFFVFAFICFEVLLTNLLRKTHSLESLPAALPVRACVALLYSLFLWASLSVITLSSLRPDMLMSGFLYLAADKLIMLSGERGRWRDYLALGVVLGIGVLAKEPMLPMAILVLVFSIFLVENRLPALTMAAVSLVIVLAIGSLYFGPLSRLSGHFTLGESGAYNYLVHVDRAGPGHGWYLEDPGQGAGAFQHPALRISQTPPVYAFGTNRLVTHPLRFDPADWMRGVRPRFTLKRQIGETYVNLINSSITIYQLLPVLMVALLFTLAMSKTELRQRLATVWPLALLAMAGCAMYALVHLEGRYIGAFLVLFVCSIMAASLGKIRGIFNRGLFTATVVLAASTLLLNPVLTTCSQFSRTGRAPNEAAIAAGELHRLGIQSGDRVARISSGVSDLAVDRIARVEVVAEVDYSYAKQFWRVPIQQQESVLQLFAAQGVKAVIATDPLLTPTNRPQWKQLASSEYWAWIPQQENSN
jgi:hypothetical protein